MDDWVVVSSRDGPRMQAIDNPRERYKHNEPVNQSNSPACFLCGEGRLIYGAPRSAISRSTDTAIRCNCKSLTVTASNRRQSRCLIEWKTSATKGGDCSTAGCFFVLVHWSGPLTTIVDVCVCFELENGTIFREKLENFSDFYFPMIIDWAWNVIFRSLHM